jgi:fibronectin-binding autotransporter adhesin
MRRSNWAVFRGGLGVAALVALSVPMKPLLAQTTLNSGTTTVTTGTDFGVSLVVADTGTATMNVIAGGYATNMFGYIGQSDGSRGTVTVSSGTWANTSDLIVGNQGTGELNVTGGIVTNVVCVIGSDSGGNGTVNVSSGTWATGANLGVGNGGTGTLNITGGLVSVAGSLSRNTRGTINLNGGGTLQIGVGSMGGVLLGGTGSLVNNGSLVFNRSNASTYSGVISGTGALTKLGDGTLTLSGNNSYTGGTTISGGQLTLGSANGLGVAGAAMAITSGTLNLNGWSVTLGVLSGSSGGTITTGGAGSVTLTSTAATDSTFAGAIANGPGVIALTKQGTGTLTLSGNNAHSGATNLNAGVLAVGGTSALGTGTLGLNGGTLRAASGGGSFAAPVSLNANTTIAGSDALTVSGNVTLNGFNTLTFTNTAQTTISGQIVESAPSILIKQGSGELQLTGANSYTGGTFVQSGTVRINNSTGSAFGAGAVTVASGATLTGAGSISGAVQMNGTWAPGNSPGLVTVNSNVVLGGTLDMELGGVLRATSGTSGTGYYDAMNVSNALALGGTLNVALYNGFVPSYGNSFEILQSGQLSGDFGTVNYPALSGGLSWERTTSATAMTITVVPEPSTYAISAIATAGLASLMRWRKRRTKDSDV